MDDQQPESIEELEARAFNACVELERIIRAAAKFGYQTLPEMVMLLREHRSLRELIEGVLASPGDALMPKKLKELADRAEALAPRLLNAMKAAGTKATN